MATVRIKLAQHEYEVHIASTLLHQLGEMVCPVAPHARAVFVADANAIEPHGHLGCSSLTDAGYDVLFHALAANEAGKNLDTVRELYDVLLDARLERRSPVITLGGGVVGDTVGFVAATYLRGVPFVQCPTTLLAMVDASVGGKVGVNVPQGKNLIGSFYQPQLVVIDTDTLFTLPKRQLRCGLAECVKHCVIRDAELFDWTEDNLTAILGLDPDALVELVRRNVQIKADFVMADEKESGPRAHLNFGHTFAHAIEATQSFGGYHHGEAVSLGMVAASRLAVADGRCEPDVLERLQHLLEQIGLPTSAPELAPTQQLLDTMRLDKKVADGRIRLVLPDRIGQVSIANDVPEAEINTAWEKLRR